LLPPLGLATLAADRPLGDAEVNRTQTTLLCALTLAAALLAGCGAPEGERFAVGVWPQWRGPQAEGITPFDNLPIEWAPESDNLKWRAELTGPGASQPIVSNGRIYLTGGRTGKVRSHRSLYAFDPADGSELWSLLISDRRKEKTHHRFGSFSNPTPVTDGETVWVYFGGLLAAVSRDGDLRWQSTVDPNYKETSRYGAASSPVLAGRAVVVFSDDEWGDEKRARLSWMAAYDRDSGVELWRTEWGDTCCSYATPLLRETADGLELIVSTTPLVLGFDLATGERLWQVDQPIVQVVPSPVMAGDLLIQAGSVHEKKILAYRLTGSGSETRAEELWREIRSAPEMASPVLYNDLLFTVTDGGIASCIEPETGELVWRERLPATGYRSSLVAGDGKVYFTTFGSVTAVVAAEREFQLLATNDLAELSESSIAVTEECLLVRTKRFLYCVERQAGP